MSNADVEKARAFVKSLALPASPPVMLGAAGSELEFDAASFVLTAMGRLNAGTARGDTEMAERFGNLFFRI